MRLAIDKCIEARNAQLEPGEPVMTQARLAELLGVNQSTVSRWASGQRELSARWAIMIARILRCSIDDLFGMPSVCQSGIR